MFSQICTLSFKEIRKFQLLSAALILSIALLVTPSTKPALAVDPKVLLAAQQVSDKAVNTQDADLLVSISADDQVYDYVPMPPPLEGKEAIREFFGGVFQAFPDLHVTSMRPPLVSGNIIVVEHIMTGTSLGELDLGPLGKIPPTGKSFQTMHMDIWGFEGDKAKRCMTYDDMASMMVQLGLMPAPESPKLVPSFTLPDPEPTRLAPLEADAEGVSRFNTHNLSEFAKMQHRDAEIKFNTLGMIPMNREEYAVLNELFLLSNSELRGDIVRRIDMGDGWVVTEAVFRGVQDGPYFGIPATGLPTEVRAAWLAHYDADGLLTNLNFYFDNMTMLAQIGAIPGPADTEANKALVRRVIEEVWNQGKLDVVDEIFATDYVLHDPANPGVRGPDGYKQLVTMYRTPFSDVHWTIEVQIAEGDKVATRWTITGTHKGEFMGIPPTGKQATVTGLSIGRIAGGKIVEEWANWDALGLLQQLGIIPPMK